MQVIKWLSFLRVCFNNISFLSNKYFRSYTQDERTNADLQVKLPAGSIVGALYTSCKHSLLLFKTGKIIGRNKLSWLKLLIKLLLLHLVGCLYYCIDDAQLHKHQKLLLFLSDMNQRCKEVIQLNNCPMSVVVHLKLADKFWEHDRLFSGVLHCELAKKGRN